MSGADWTCVGRPTTQKLLLLSLHHHEITCVSRLNPDGKNAIGRVSRSGRRGDTSGIIFPFYPAALSIYGRDIRKHPGSVAQGGGFLPGPLPPPGGTFRRRGSRLLAYATFPVEHWKQIWSSNPLEWVNKEIKRRPNVVGIFPNPD